MHSKRIRLPSVQPKFIFIVGNSRSGTTMLMRMLDKHPEVCALNEWHFFEQLWSAKEALKLSQTDACDLASRLLGIQRNGFRAGYQSNKYDDEASEIVDKIGIQNIHPIEVYTATAYYETHLNQKLIPCEKTPQNVFYIKEILDMIPGARVVNLIRDPRSVLLSQKKKANRRKMGARWMNRKEAFRLSVNYHPITVSRLWKSSIMASMPFKEHAQVVDCYFENIMTNPKLEIGKICEFLDLQFYENMLDIEQVGSSVKPDDYTKVGVIQSRAVAWDRGGLSDAEIYLCQKSNSDLMKYHQYAIRKVTPSYLKLTYYYLSFPVKLILAFILNLHRMKNVVESIKRRLTNS